MHREAFTQLEDGGEPATVAAVLKALDVALVPTLRRGDAVIEPSRSADGVAADSAGLLSLGRFQLLGELGRRGPRDGLRRGPEATRGPRRLVGHGRATVPLCEPLRQRAVVRQHEPRLPAGACAGVPIQNDRS